MGSEHGDSNTRNKRRQRADGRGEQEAVTFLIPNWAMCWAALGVACTAAVFLLDLPILADSVLYLITVVSGFQLFTELHGVRVTPTSVIFPVRPSYGYPLLSVWIRRLDLDEIQRVTARKTSSGRQLVSLKTASGDMPVYFVSHRKRREFSHLLGELRPALVFRKNR